MFSSDPKCGWGNEEHGTSSGHLDAIAVGFSMNAATPEMVKGGAEIVLNFNSGEVSLFTYGGGGGSVGASVNSAVYVAVVNNLPNNASYAGPFYAVDVTAAVGVPGVMAGHFGVPMDNPLAPTQAYGNYIGWAYGAGLSSSNQLVYYSPPLVTYNVNGNRFTTLFSSVR